MYDGAVILLSFGIAFVGSYASITACEQYRLSKIGIINSRYVPPLAYLLVMAVSLGGVGIWCMHFVGMSAVGLTDPSGKDVEVRYDIGITIVSLLLVIFFSSVGFYIASHDKVFMKTKREIVDMFVEDSSAMSMKDIRKMKTLRMVFLIATRAPQHLLVGGLINGSGVVMMHYLGMAAMRFPGHIVWNFGVITSSVLIAFVASVAAFWILFRLLSIYPDKENLRIVCAVTMALAVCGMHYTGMVAAEFVHDTEVFVDTESSMTSKEAFLAGVLAAASVTLVVALLAFADLRQSVLRMSTELYRADTVLKSIPATNPCAATVKKYIAKRKANGFSLGVLNDTAMLQDHEWSDDLSVTSSDDQPSCLQYLYYRLKYRLCGAPAHAHTHAPAHAPYETTSPRGGQYLYGQHSRSNSSVSGVHRPPTRGNSSSNLDNVPTSPVASKPSLSHSNTAASTVFTSDAATSYHAPVAVDAPPSALRCEEVAASVVDLEAGLGNGEVTGCAV